MMKALKQTQTADLISSMEHIYRLKSIPRSGWVQSGIPAAEVESIASHSYGMAMLILSLRSELLAKGIDVERALSMAILHDVAESIVGDLTPRDGISPEDKYTAESEAFYTITGEISERDHFRKLWEDFEAGSSPEAQLVKRIDKLDMLIQAYLYEKNYKVRLDSFWDHTDASLFAGSESEPIYEYIRSNRFEA